MEWINNPLVLILLFMAGFFIAPFLYNWLVDFKFWIIRKYILLTIGITLFYKSKDKKLRTIAWDAIRLVFWEKKNNYK